MLAQVTVVREQAGVVALYLPLVQASVDLEAMVSAARAADALGPCSRMHGETVVGAGRERQLEDSDLHMLGGAKTLHARS